MDITMMHKMRQTTLLTEGIVGAAAIGRGGFAMLSNGWQTLGMIGAGQGGFAALACQRQRTGIYTLTPLFVDVDGIGAPRRRRLKS